MCTAIGVDPLASSTNKKGSFWAEMLGTSVNDFYFELAVRVVEVCRRTREENGGLIAIGEVKERISKQDEMVGGSSNVSELVTHCLQPRITTAYGWVLGMISSVRSSLLNHSDLGSRSLTLGVGR